jgi:hypothetical protein
MVRPRSLKSHQKYQPLSHLGGIIAAFLFLIFRGILALKIFPQLGAAAAGRVILKIINYLFILAVTAIILGFFGYVIGVVGTRPAAASTKASVDLMNGTTFEDAAARIAEDEDASVRFTDCSEDVRKIKVRPGHLAAASARSLIEDLQYRFTGTPGVVAYRVTHLPNQGLFEIECAGKPAALSHVELTPTPTSHVQNDIVSSIGMRLHWVDLLRTWVGETEVTQAEFREVMGTNPSRYRSDAKPVDKVCLETAKKFCETLTDKDRAAGILNGDMTYRLPHEEEFEAYFDGATASEAVISIFETRNGTSDVRTFAPNRFGLYDVLGNVWEWMENGTLRGACWDTTEWRDAQVGYRLVPNPLYNCQNFGFRCVLSQDH